MSKAIASLVRTCSSCGHGSVCPDDPKYGICRAAKHSIPDRIIMDIYPECPMWVANALAQTGEVATNQEPVVDRCQAFNDVPHTSGGYVGWVREQCIEQSEQGAKYCSLHSRYPDVAPDFLLGLDQDG